MGMWEGRTKKRPKVAMPVQRAMKPRMRMTRSTQLYRSMKNFQKREETTPAAFCATEYTAPERGNATASMSPSPSTPYPAFRRGTLCRASPGDSAPDDRDGLRRDSVFGSVPWPLSVENRRPPSGNWDSCSAMASVDTGMNEARSCALPSRSPLRPRASATRDKTLISSWAAATQVTTHPSLWCALLGYRSGVFAS